MSISAQHSHPAPIARRLALVVCATWLLAGTLTPARADDAATAGDITAGRRVFFTRCTACHSPVPGQNKVGPSLAGILGRPAGSESDFNYSPALKGAGFDWDAAHLDHWLASPRDFLPGSRMTFALGNEADRQNVIAYLATLAAAQK
ncbi:c-type cytochrome [Radicibacter daui]|uniref:c-type cytochrome n=1 Tax=Radicibacter daui TaxID=3064829 RepID=UPI004046BF47